jgi:histidinol-phosphate aminotransferase
MVLPEHIKSIQPYVPGKPVKELERELGIRDSVKLASNENPTGPSPLALKAIGNALSGLNRYPEGSCYYLRSALAGKLGINEDELIFGNGSNEIIELAVRTFMSPGDEAVMAHPSFVVYSLIVQAAGCRSIIIPLKQWRHDLEAMAGAITGKTKLVFIANPNNPTGTFNTDEELEAMMSRVPDNVLVVMDEAYYEYVASPHYADSMKFLRSRDMLILRTFSKIYGLAGLRIGYGMAKADIVDAMNRVRQPFNVNSLAQEAALAALRDDEHVRKSREVNEAGKRFLYSEFDAAGIQFVPTEANFIYLPLQGEKASALYDTMLQAGVIIRPAGPSAVRITIGTMVENRRLVTELKKALSQL